MHWTVIFSAKDIWREVYTERSRSEPMWDHFFSIETELHWTVIFSAKDIWREVYTERSRSEPMWDHFFRLKAKSNGLLLLFGKKFIQDFEKFDLFVENTFIFDD